MGRKNFAERFSTLRQQRGLTLQQLGDALGMSNQAVSLLEKGERVPSFDALCNIVDFFGVSFDFLLGGEKISNGELTEKTGEPDGYLDKILPPPYNCYPHALLTSLLERGRDNAKNDPSREKILAICCSAAYQLIRERSEYLKKTCYDKIEDAEDDYLNFLKSGRRIKADTKIYEAIHEFVRYERRREKKNLRWEAANILSNAVTTLLTDESEESEPKWFEKAMKGEV